MDQYKIELPRLKFEYKKCNECNQIKSFLNQRVCQSCAKAKIIPLSGNKIVDDFIRHINIRANSRKYCEKLEFVHYDKFKDVELLAEGGFSKIYKATWIDGPTVHFYKMIVVLKELNDSKNISFKGLSELKTYYAYNLDKSNLISSYYVNKYYGITQHPVTLNFMIIMDYCESGDLAHYISYNFFNISWKDKLRKLYNMTIGLSNIHFAGIIHKDFHSGNIFISYYSEAITGDLGLSKSSINYDEDNGIYGIIPYVAPEVLQGQKYSKASDIYSFGMIMWELMTGRRPFWDRNHDTDLIIEICDGLRPPIVTDAPEGYIELMQKCWHFDPNKRPTVKDLYSVFASDGKLFYVKEDNKLTINLESPDIGPITNNPGAIYKSRSLSAMIKSAESTRSLRSLRIYNRNTTLIIDKRKLKDDDNDKKDNPKKIRLSETENNDYLTKELEFDINDNNINFIKSNKNDYISEEINFDI